MASTPSASALSAVLRCRRNIWPAPSARLSGSKARALSAETVSLWDALTRGIRVVLGRLALSCLLPWKTTRSEKVSQSLSQSARGRSAACTRILLSAHHAKVAFVWDSGGRTVCLSPRVLDTAERERAWLWMRSGCASMTSLLSYFVLDLFRTGPGPEDEATSPKEEPQSPGAVADSGPAGGNVCEDGLTEDRPD